MLRPLFILLISTLWFSLLFTSCKKESRPALAEPELRSQVNDKPVEITYARNFKITGISKGVRELTIFRGEDSTEVPLKYLLVSKALDTNLPAEVKGYKAVVKTPLKRIIATSTTHIPALDVLGELESLKAFPDTRYISSPKAVRLVLDNSVQDLGPNEGVNTEMALRINPEAVIGFQIGSESTAYKTLSRLGIPVIINADWTEQHPLGRAEWIKFFGALYEKDSLADTIFKEIENAYESARSLGKKARVRPTVISGAIYQQAWYLPAGNSWFARFLQDAGANYLWEGQGGTGSLALTLEAVLEKGYNADYWIGCAQFTSFEEMRQSNEQYRHFRAFRDKRIFSSSFTSPESEGIPFYELGPQRPDLILLDLIAILHPELLPNHQPVFFHRLHENAAR